MQRLRANLKMLYSSERILIDKKLEFYNKMTEDKVNSLFKNMWFNEIYDDRVRGMAK